MFLWQFLPEYLFPFVASLAPLCWFASRSHKLNFLGAGRGGAGLLNITLDWSNITSTVITYPYSVQVIVFVAFVITVCLLAPIKIKYIDKCTNVWKRRGSWFLSRILVTFGDRQLTILCRMESSRRMDQLTLLTTWVRKVIQHINWLFLAENILVYTDLKGVQHVNETRYHEIGLAYSGAQYMWDIFMVCPREENLLSVSTNSS